MPVEKKCDSKKHDRQIPIGQKFSPNKSSNVYLKTTPPRSGLTWKSTGRIFTQVCLKWIPIRKSVETHYNTNDSASPLVVNSADNDVINKVINWTAFQLRYHESGRSTEVNPSVGQWNMIDLKMINGGTMNYWTIINFSRQNEQAVGRFVNGLLSMCQTKGIVFNPQPLIRMLHEAPNNIERALVNLYSQCSAQLAKSAPGHQLQRCCLSFFQKLKELIINVKVGGRNIVLSTTLNGRLPYVTDRPTIIFGADVTHPQPGEDSSPSIAAVDFGQACKLGLSEGFPMPINSEFRI
ncbi:PAZ domain-containing protein [Tanacetum coccineum]